LHEGRAQQLKMEATLWTLKVHQSASNHGRLLQTTADWSRLVKKRKKIEHMEAIEATSRNHEGREDKDFFSNPSLNASRKAILNIPHSKSILEL